MFSVKGRVTEALVGGLSRKEIENIPGCRRLPQSASGTDVMGASAKVHL